MFHRHFNGNDEQIGVGRKRSHDEIDDDDDEIVICDWTLSSFSGDKLYLDQL